MSMTTDKTSSPFRPAPAERRCRAETPAARDGAAWKSKEAGGDEAARDDGGTRLSRQAVLLLVVNGLFAAATAVSGTFVNVFLWKTANELTLIGWFTVATYLTHALTFLLAGKWVKEHNKMNCLRLGVAMSAVFYLVVLLLKKQAVHYVFVLGVLQGFALGLFWLAFNVVYFEITGPDNRDRFNGWAGLLSSLSGMTAPWVSGFLITRMEGMAGYLLVFAISLAIFVIAAVFSFFLRKRKVTGKYDWKYGVRQLRGEGNPWRRAVPASVSQGVREGVFAFLISLLVYIVTSDEMKLGNYWLITSAVGLFSFWLAGKLLKPSWRNAAMLSGTAAMIAVILPFFWDVNYTTLLVFGIGTALFMPIYTIPLTSTIFDLIGRNRDSAAHRVEHVVLRELALNTGRVAGTLVFIAVIGWRHTEQTLNWLLLGIGSFPLVSWLFMRSLFKDGYRAEGAESGDERRRRFLAKN